MARADSFWRAKADGDFDVADVSDKDTFTLRSFPRQDASVVNPKPCHFLATVRDKDAELKRTSSKP